MILVEPGLLSVTSWEPDGPRIVERYRDLAKFGEELDYEGMRLIQDRYQKLLIPKRERRPHLGDAALQHLGLPVARGTKSIVYVAVLRERIDVLGPAYRNTKNLAGHPSLDDLP